MARRPLAIGEIGNISVSQKNGKTVARCRVRAQDGTMKFAQATIPKTTKTAEREARALCLRDAEEKAGANVTDGNITLDSPLNALIDEWWEGEVARKENGEITSGTLDVYKRPADTIRAGIGSTLKLRECTTQRLQRYVLETAGPHYTVHRDLKRTLKAIFDRGLELGVVDYNSAAHIRRPVVPKNTTTALEPDEVVKLRRLVHDYENGGANRVDPKTGKRKGGRPRSRYLADLVDLLLATGMRIGEVLALRWEDVDLTVDESMQSATVEVTGTIKTQKAAPAKGIPYVYRQGHPKSQRSKRIITVPKFAVDILLRRKVNAGDGELVFSTSKGTPMSPPNVRTALRKACGTDFEGLTPHTLRRTVATLVAEQYGIETASRILGHSGIAITDRAYYRPGLKAPDATGALEGLGAPLTDVVRVSQASPSTRVSESA